MEDDSRSLLASEQTGESSLRGSTDSLDIKVKRPFHVEPRNIVDDEPQERVSAEAAILNSRVHYYSKLTGSSDRLLSPPNHVIPRPEELYIYSPLGTAFKYLSPLSGTSLVFLFCFNNKVLFVIHGFLTPVFTFSVSVDTSDWEFPDVCRHYFGKFGQWSSLFFSMISLIGAMVVYWVLMSNFLFNSGQFIYNYAHNVNVSDNEYGTNGSDKVICPFPNVHPDSNGSSSLVDLNTNETSDSFAHWWSKTHTIPLYLIVLLLPLLCFRSASFFARFTFLGTISVIYLISLVTYKAIRLGFHLEFHWFDHTQFFVSEFRLQFPQLTGVLTLAFFIHNCVITLMKSNKHQENNVRDLSVAYLLVGLTYLYVGVLIFASFPSPPLTKECIEPNFLDNFPSSDVLVFVARAFLLFQMVTVYPLLGYLVRVQVMTHFFGSSYPSFFHVLLLNIFIVGAGVLTAIFYPNIGSIIRFSGAMCGLALVFVFPALIHMISLHRQGALTWPSAVFHSFLILLGIANLLAQFFM
uniref:Neutral amino acid transporter 9 n=1 Tax=Neogobius melanostomus TaxID=47308 RepID=A0A8C6SE32_9GOBI